MVRKQIGRQIACSYILEPHRKINMLSINFIMPITGGNCTIRSMLPFILCESCKKFPSNKLLTFQLYELYGANLEAVVDVVGLYQIVGINISFADNRFSCDDEDIMCKCIELITEILTKPNFINEQFDFSDVVLVKEFMKDIMLSEYYDERHILIRCIQKMQGYDILENCYGNQKDISFITPELLTDAYKMLLCNSSIEILFIGTKDSDMLYSFVDKIRSWRRGNKMIYTPNYPYNETIVMKEEIEYTTLDVSKLVMGFYIMGTHDPFAIWLLSIIYGNAPFSRLFIILREKQGLCYDCSMEYEPFSYTMFFICSLEAANKEIIQFNVINALEKIKNDGISNNELDNAKQLAKNKLLSFHKSTDAMWEWSILQILHNQIDEPKASLKYIDSINASQIEKVASDLVLKSIYFLDNQQGERKCDEKRISFYAVK